MTQTQTDGNDGQHGTPKGLGAIKGRRKLYSKGKGKGYFKLYSEGKSSYKGKGKYSKGYFN